MMIVGLIISLVIFIGYIYFICKLYGLPESISESAYLMGNKGKIIFYISMLLIAIPLMIHWLDVTEGTDTQFLAFLSCASLCFVGITSRYKTDSMQGWIHRIAAIACAICSQLWAILVIDNWWIVCTVIFPVILLFASLCKAAKVNIITGSIEHKAKPYLFFGEVACFILNYIALIIY